MPLTIADFARPICRTQIRQIVKEFETLCLTEASSLPMQQVERLLRSNHHQVAVSMLNNLREHVERKSPIVVRRVSVPYETNPDRVLAASRRNEYVDREIIGEMPGLRSRRRLVDVYFFKANRRLSLAAVESRYLRLGLVPDAVAVARVNTREPRFAMERPNAVQFRDRTGRICAVTFHHLNDEADVDAFACNRDWTKEWWFGGVRAS